MILLVGCGGLAAPPAGPVITVVVDGHPLRAEVAATSAQRQYGLMGRTHLAADEAMLFVYAKDRPGLWFWMKDTPLPLSIAFIDKEHRIVNMADMQPLDETTHYTAAAPCRYVLEVPQGWFGAHDIQPGALVEFDLPPNIIAAE